MMIIINKKDSHKLYLLAKLDVTENKRFQDSF